MNSNHACIVRSGNLWLCERVGSTSRKGARRRLVYRSTRLKDACALLGARIPGVQAIRALIRWAGQIVLTRVLKAAVLLTAAVVVLCLGWWLHLYRRAQDEETAGRKYYIIGEMSGFGNWLGMAEDGSIWFLDHEYGPGEWYQGKGSYRAAANLKEFLVKLCEEEGRWWFLPGQPWDKVPWPRPETCLMPPTAARKPPAQTA